MRVRSPFCRAALTGMAVAILSPPIATTAQQPGAALRTRIDSVFAPYDQPSTPGCALGVLDAGRVAYARGYGLASIEHAVPLNAETVFDIGSVSKQFTSAAILLLAQDGRLSLDDDIRRHLPELPDYGTRLTIRHLLQHTSGLRDYTDLMALAGHQTEDYTTVRQAFDVIIRARTLNFAPGAAWRYSNTGYFLLSIVIERATGMSIRKFAEQRLFAPLGMTSSFYFDDHAEVVPRRATAYSRRDSGGFRVDMSDWEQLGDGGVQTTVTDLAKWDEAFYSGKVLGRALIDQMTTPGALTDGAPHEYGLGLRMDHWRGLARVSHGGAWGGYRAMLMRFPTKHVSVALLCNRGDANTGTLAERVASVWLGGALAPLPEIVQGAESSRSADIALDTGVYINEFEGLVRYVSAGPHGLVFGTRPGAGGQAVYAVAGRFRLTSGATLTFDRTQRTLTIEASSLGPRPVVLDRLDARHRAPAALGPYAGRYYSDEADVTYRVAVKGSSLVWNLPEWPALVLEPIALDLFRGGGMLLRFERDAGGGVTGLRVTDRGMVRLPFRRVAAAPSD